MDSKKAREDAHKRAADIIFNNMYHLVETENRDDLLVATVLGAASSVLNSDKDYILDNMSDLADLVSNKAEKIK